VALTASTLEKRFGIYRPAAQQFMADHQQEIEAHAQTHAITAPAHNRGLPEGLWETIKQMIADEQEGGLP
jgi:D-alanyl-D-alanine dipeptidase